jgi:hypothetical protein
MKLKRAMEQILASGVEKPHPVTENTHPASKKLIRRLKIRLGAYISLVITELPG